MMVGPTSSSRRVATIEIMANTYTSLHYHIIFSTKNRELWMKPDVEQRIWAYLGGIAKQNKMKPLQIGGIEDHVHVLLGAPPVLAPAKIAQNTFKGSASITAQRVSKRNMSPCSSGMKSNLMKRTHGVDQ